MSRSLQRLLNPVDGEDDPPVAVAFDSNGFLSNAAINDPSLLGTGYSFDEYFPNELTQSGVVPNFFGDVSSIISDSTILDPNLSQQLDITTLGNATNYSLGADLEEWGNNTITQLDSNSYNNWSQPSTIPSQDSSLSPSVGVFSSQSNPESVTDIDEDDVTVCYGMLNSMDIKLVGDMPTIDLKLREAESIHQCFELGIEQDNVIVRFPGDEIKFGYLRSSDAKTITRVLSQPNVNFEPVASIPALKEVIDRANKPNEAMVKLDINVYGPRRESSRVGGALSQGKLWLQRPDHSRSGILYENPQFLRLKIMGGDIEALVPVEQAANNGAPRTRLREDQLRRLVEEVYRSVDNSRDLERVEGGSRVTQQLLRHQQEALAFMLERESGHINDRYRLWREVTLEDGKIEYQHKITKARRPVRPEEKGGGILADEMGMGKSLSILALTMKTLDDGQIWAEQLNSGQTSKKKITYSRSTLIVVSSGLLITNWMTEIETHLESGLTVIKYHGRRRPKDVSIIQDSDIVLTTYNTLAVEYQNNKIEPSVLHHIGWYRVVLDEAHIIRRPSSVFHHSCSDLQAHSRWCLTGTPIQNKLADIGTLFAFIRAEPFNKASVFRKWIEVAFEHTADNPRQVKNRLVMLLEAFCLRRTKDVLNLPCLRQTIRMLDFTPHEREQYDRTERILLRSIKQHVGGNDKGSKFGLFQANLQLRILCNHGTFQKPFSWHRHLYQDEREAVGAVLGRDGEIKCSGCQQPMPIVGSSWLKPMFRDKCSHVLCSECIEESNTPGFGVQPQRCPVCVRWRKSTLIQDSQPAANAGDESGDVNMSNAPVIMAVSDDGDDYYFNTDGHSTKMKKLVEDVATNLWERKSIIFSCWTRTLHLVSKHLREANIPFLCIDGNCPLQQRQENLNQFESNKEVPVLIMTTGTGAFGLNLTCANRIFIVELQWNPSVENQAIARAIRFGQKNEVQVTRYIIRNTVEESMRKQQQWKKQIAAIGFEEVPETIDVEMQHV